MVLRSTFPSGVSRYFAATAYYRALTLSFSLPSPTPLEWWRVGQSLPYRRLLWAQEQVPQAFWNRRTRTQGPCWTFSRTTDVTVRFFTSRHLDCAFISLFFREKYMLGVERNAIRLPCDSHSLTMKFMVALEYQYWLNSDFSLCRARKGFKLSILKVKYIY